MVHGRNATEIRIAGLSGELRAQPDLLSTRLCFQFSRKVGSKAGMKVLGGVKAGSKNKQ